MLGYSIEHSYPITIIIPLGNRKDVLEDCIKSAEWADEVLIVDSFSTDGSFQIAKKYNVRIIQREYNNSAEQKNWAIPQAKHEWVMILDTDERISKDLKIEIINSINNSGKVVGYKIPRVNYFLGRPVMHGGYFPDFQIRLFKRDLGRYDLRKVHSHIQLDGPQGTIRAPIIHYAHQSLDQTLKNLLILMTTWEAEQRKPTIHKSNLWFEITIRPIGAFFLRYFKQGGWRDGLRGLIISMIWAMYVSITYMKVWEQRLNLPEEWWSLSWKDYQSHDNK